MFHDDYLPKTFSHTIDKKPYLTPSSSISNFTNSFHTIEVCSFSFVFFPETLFGFLNFDFELTFKDGEGLVEVSIITLSSSFSKFTAGEAVVL